MPLQFNGVSWDKRWAKWKAYITPPGCKAIIKKFNDEKEAARFVDSVVRT